jgi:hypothetical protein
MNGKHTTDRGFSDLIGFVLMFSIIVGSVSIIYVAGFDNLEELKNTEDVQTADRAMRGVAETFEDIHRQGAPSRSLDIGVDGANLDLVDSALELRVDDGTTTYERTLTTQALVIGRESQTREVVYESGALFQVNKQNAGSIVRHRPVFSCDDDTAILSVVRLQGDLSISVDDPVQVTGTRVETERLYPRPNGPPKATTITIDTTDSRYTGAWQNYFNRLGSEQDWEQVSGSPAEFECDVDRVFIRQTTIEVTTVQ